MMLSRPAIGDVDARSLGAEGGKVGGHHHCGDVARADRLPANIDAKPLDHHGQRLLGEWDVVGGVASTVKSDDQAIPDQLDLPRAFDIGEILDARRRPGFRRDTRSRPGKRGIRKAARNNPGGNFLPGYLPAVNHTGSGWYSRTDPISVGNNRMRVYGQ